MDEEEKEVNDSQNELCQAHGLNVAHVQKVTEALRIPVRKTKDEVAHVLSEEKSELSEENIDLKHKAKQFRNKNLPVPRSTFD